MSGTPQRLQSISVPELRIVYELACVLLDVNPGDTHPLNAARAFDVEIAVQA